MWGSSLSCCLVSQVYNHQDRSKGKCCNLLHCVSFRTRPRVLDAFASLWGTRRVWEILHLSLNSFQLPGIWSAQWIASSSGGRGRKKPSGNQKLREFTSTKTPSTSTCRIWFEPLVNTCFSFVSSVRSSSGYHGLIEIRAANPLFQIFQIQILKWKWKWKDPTCAIFLKSMGFKDVEYDIPVYQM